MAINPMYSWRWRSYRGGSADSHNLIQNYENYLETLFCKIVNYKCMLPYAISVEKSIGRQNSNVLHR